MKVEELRLCRVTALMLPACSAAKHLVFHCLCGKTEAEFKNGKSDPGCLWRYQFALLTGRVSCSPMQLGEVFSSWKIP